MSVTATRRPLRGIARRRSAISAHPGERNSKRIGGRIRWIGIVAGMACLATVATTGNVSAQKKKPSAKEISEVAGLVVMTPNGPATCSTWIEWRSPTADPIDKAAIEYWAEGYLSGLAAGSRRDVIGAFRHEAMAAWLNKYCAANPTTPLPEAIVALGLAMLAHPDGKL